MRKLFSALTLFLFLFAQSSFAMREVVFSGHGRIQQLATAYNFFHGVAGAFNVAENKFRQFIPRNAVLSKFKVELSAAPGVGRSVTFTVRASGADTPISCTVADLNLSCSYDPPLEVAAFQVITVKEVPFGTPALANARYSIVVTTPSNRELILTGGKAPTIITLPAQAFIPAHGGTVTELTTEFLSRTTLPFSGKVTELHVNFPPGAGSQATTFTTFYKGMVTPQTCTALENVGSCSDTGHAFSFEAGDTISVFNSGIFVPQNSGVSLVVIPDSPGDSLSALAGTGVVSSTSNRYQYFSVGSAPWNATEANVLTLGQAGPITKDAEILRMFVQANQLPSSGSYAITLRENQTSTLFSCTISFGSPSADCGVSGELTLVDGREYDVLVVPSATEQLIQFSEGIGFEDLVPVPEAPLINVGFRVNLKQRRTSIIN